MAGEPYEALFDDLLARTVLTDAQLSELEKVTREQFQSSVWFLQRIGRLTASCYLEIYKKLEQLLHHKQNVPITPTLSKIMGSPKSLKTLPSVKWGNDHEGDAAASFYKEALKEHNCPRLLSCGIFACPQLPFISATPDRMMKFKCCPDRCVEIKCPFSLKETPFSLGWEGLGYMERTDDKIGLKKPCILCTDPRSNGMHWLQKFILHSVGSDLFSPTL